MRALAVLLVAMTAWTAACDDDSTRPPPAGDSRSPPSPGGGGGSEGGVPQPDGGDEGGEGGICNDLPNTGIVVDQAGIVSDPPAGTGGQIVDGVYDLTESRLYVGIAGNPGETGISYKGSLRLTGGTYESTMSATTAANGQTQTRIVKGTFTTLGGNFTLVLSCPTAIRETSSYSVAGSTLTFVNPVTRESFTYTKK